MFDNKTPKSGLDFFIIIARLRAFYTNIIKERPYFIGDILYKDLIHNSDKLSYWISSALR